MSARSHPAEHHAQIVCGHFGDNRNRESNGLRHSCDHFEVSQTPSGCDRESSGRALGCSGPLPTLRVCMDHRDRTATPEGVSRRP
jgi:hypothetical protein